MCHTSCIIFGAKNLEKNEIEGKKVIEVGSNDHNGSLRAIVESYNPKEYVGVDIINGPGVDMICNAEEIVEKFGEESFDVVISTEMIEHVVNWKKVISNIKKICKPHGIIILTTRSYGYHYHAAPYDFWRYEIDDMKHIFSDFKILSLEKDNQHSGVFIKLEKITNYIETDLSEYELYSVIANKRIKEINGKDFKSYYYLKLYLKEKLKISIFKVAKFVIGSN